jgi:hypothetical protein
MDLFAVVFLATLFFVPVAWYVGYRRAMRANRSKLSSHGRGLLYGIGAIFCGFVGLVVTVGSRTPDSPSTTIRQNAVAKVATPATAPVTPVSVPATSERHQLQLLATQMYHDKHFDLLDAALENRNTDTLKIIPALGGKSNVARVLKTRGIGIGLNADLSCFYFNKLANAPGCMLTVYITRRPNKLQTDLSGVPAHWFMGLNDSTFRPLPGWAEHIDKNDNWLDETGMLGYADNR